MTRAEFLGDLYRRLGPSMSQEEAEQYLTYYAEMLADRIEEGMTEEEAVGSMEDVDTIADRIFQERGEEPPRYPDPPAAEKSTEPPSPAVPEKARRRWVLPMVIGLVAVGACAALAMGLRAVTGIGGKPFYGIYIGDDGIRIGNVLAIDNDGIRVGPGGSGVEVSEEGITVGGNAVIETAEELAPLEAAAVEAAVEEVYYVDAQDIRDLTVDWVAGSVSVEVWDGEEIAFFESCGKPLDEDNILRYSIEDKELNIQFSREKIKAFPYQKDLLVRLPKELVLDEVEVNSVSGQVQLTKVCGQELCVNTVSGDCVVTEGRFDSLSFGTISGSATLQGNVQEVEFDSTSGDLLIKDNNILRELEADTVSGNIDVSTSLEKGFDLTFDTASGDLDATTFPIRQERDGEYASGDKGVRMDVDTTSGDLKLREG